MINMFGFLRVAAASPPTRTGDCTFNTDEIIKVLHEACRRSIRVLIFPELSLTGYSCGDLFLQSALLNKAEESLCRLLSETCDLDIFFVIGIPLRTGNGLFNCAAALYKGKVAGIVPKTHLADSGGFSESRVFAPARLFPRDYAEINGEKIPAGTDILFRLGQSAAAGIEIGGDLCHPLPPGIGQAQNGATLLLNLSASPEIAGRQKQRQESISALSARLNAAYVYASAGIGESVSDFVFGGHCIISENGKILSEKPPFEYNPCFTAADADMELLINSRRTNTGFNEGIAGKYREIPIPLGKTPLTGSLMRYISSNPFFPDDKGEHGNMCRNILRIQQTALARRLEHTKAACAVINISGGLDSTLALLVAAGAMDLLNRSRRDILCLTLPGFGTTSRTHGNAVKLVDEIGAEIREISIERSCLLHFEDIGLDPARRDVNYENAQARERTQIAMDIANMEGGFMVGTGDMSELALGFCTYGGDHISMYNPNAGVTKTAIRSVIKWAAESGEFGSSAGKTLLDILDTPVSPELLPPGENGEIVQITEEKIGPYDLHDFFLYHMLKNGFSKEKILFMAKAAFADKYAPGIISRWLGVFTSRFISQQYKRSCSPESPQVLELSLSPRSGLRMPGDFSGEF